MNSTSRPCSPSSNSSARASNFQTASFLPRFTFPSPLVEEGRVGGREATLHSSTPARHLSTPPPNPTPQGGGERARSAGKGGVGLNAAPIVLATHARPSYANANHKKPPQSTIPSDLAGGGTGFHHNHARLIKGKRNAGRRVVKPPRLADAASPLRTSPVCEGGTEGGSPVGVPPRHLLQRTNAAAQLQNALPGTWSGRTIPMVRKIMHFSTGITRSFLSQSSDQVADRSSCRPGVFPKPPGSGGDEPPPAGTALAPSTGVTG